LEEAVDLSYDRLLMNECIPLCFRLQENDDLLLKYVGVFMFMTNL
jgi:hypothetical protein